jgi:hypothetical protein
VFDGIGDMLHFVGERLAGFHDAPPPVVHAAASLVARAHMGDASASRKIVELGRRNEALAELFGHAHAVIQSPEFRSLGGVLPHRTGAGHGGGGHGGHHGAHGGGGGGHHGHGRDRDGGPFPGGVAWGGPYWWGWPVDLELEDDDDEEQEQKTEAIATAGEYVGGVFDTRARDRFRTNLLQSWQGPRGRGAAYLLCDRRAMDRIRPIDDQEPDWLPPVGVRGD